MLLFPCWRELKFCVWDDVTKLSKTLYKTKNCFPLIFLSSCMHLCYKLEICTPCSIDKVLLAMHLCITPVVLVTNGLFVLYCIILYCS